METKLRMAYPTSNCQDAPELTWEIAQLFPAQGYWSEEEYFSLGTNRLIEFSHGRLEILPTPTQSHQLLLAALFDHLYRYVSDRDSGMVLFAPMRIQLWPGKFRQPDIVFMAAEHTDSLGEQFWRGADLVMEVVNPDDPRRDTVTKRREYAQAGIPEYWIVDPTDASVSVFSLDGSEYSLHGKFVTGETANSALLDGFMVEVASVLAEAS